jgi:glyoxylase-like metal-dependent hydrolase (beta-lactamase superfamily II)
LPTGMMVFERGWLSSNNSLFQGKDSTALIDSGYSTHAEQTIGLLAHALQARPLDLLLNTHLHSDHCGGNALLQTTYPAVHTHIPPGQALSVSAWDPVALTYVPTGQVCERFVFDALLCPGKEILLADLPWEVHAAPGHDPHSVIFFEPQSRTLISADALWENGFGVVFPELEGTKAFEEVAETLSLIEQLKPCTVVPGHGAVFNYTPAVMAAARQRLAAFEKNPARHAHHAAKVLVKFKLLEQQQMLLTDLIKWAAGTSYFGQLQKAFFTSHPFDAWIAQLAQELVHSTVAKKEGEWLFNA